MIVVGNAFMRIPRAASSNPRNGSMPASFYRWYYRAHSLKSLERNILGFCGIGPINVTLVGGVGNLKKQAAQRFLTTIESLGRRAN